MKKLVIKQNNQVSRVTEMTSLKRNASEQDDVRIEGQGVSIRLPFLPTLQRLLFQDNSTIDFYRDRIKKHKEGGFLVDGFDSPVALFNFLLPSYHLSTLDAGVVEEDTVIAGFNGPIKCSLDDPGFVFTYRASKHWIDFSPVMLDILIKSDRCYVSMWVESLPVELASCLIKISLEDKVELDPIPY
jgi:hypothetical protein